MVSARPLVWRGRRGPRDQPGARLGGGGQVVLAVCWSWSPCDRTGAWLAGSHAQGTCQLFHRGPRRPGAPGAFRGHKGARGGCGTWAPGSLLRAGAPLRLGFPAWPLAFTGWRALWPQTSRFPSLVFSAFIHTVVFQPEAPSVAQCGVLQASGKGTGAPWV